MTQETMTLVLSIAGFIIALCFTVIGFFLKILHGDVRCNTTETGRNKGRFDQLEIQLKNEKESRIKDIESSNQLTNQSIQQLTSEVTKTNSMMQVFIEHQIKK